MSFEKFQKSLTSLLIAIFILQEFFVLPGMLWSYIFLLYLFIIFYRSFKAPFIIAVIGEVISVSAIVYLLYSARYISVFLLFINSLIILIYSFPASFKNHLYLFFISFIGMFSLYLFNNIENIWLLILLISYVFVFSVYFVILLLRHDIEHHHIVKHRLGRESRKVEVSRLLNSKKILDRDLKFITFINASFILLFSILLFILFFPFLSKTKNSSGRQYKESFPRFFNLNNQGELSLSSKKKLTLHTINSDVRSLPPFYLRGIVLDFYEKGIWYSNPDFKILNTSQCIKTSNRYKIIQADHSSYGFTTLDTCSVIGDNRLLSFDEEKVLRFSDRFYSQYILEIGNSKPPFIATNNYLLQNNKIPASILKLGRNLTAGINSSKKKVEAILKYLKSYSYSTNYGKSKINEDPIEKFLFKTKKGPCGLFASAAALLFRAAGVSSRLVLGYSHGTREQNTVIFSGKNAHSWVEVFDENLGWITIDPTKNIRRNTQYKKKTSYSIRMSLGLISLIIMILIIIAVIIYFLFQKKSQLELDRSKRKRIKVASFTSREASLIFNEILDQSALSNFPRAPGESAVNYATRLESENHPLSEEILNASNYANIILFSGINDSTRMEYITKLKEIMELVKNYRTNS